MDFIEQHGDEMSLMNLKSSVRRSCCKHHLRVGKLTRDPSPSSEECSYRTTNESNINDVNLPCSVKSGVDEDYVPSADFPRISKRTTDSGKMNGRVSKKSKRVTEKDTEHEEDYMTEVEKLAKIKQKQEEEEKLADAKLWLLC